MSTRILIAVALVIVVGVATAIVIGAIPLRLPNPSVYLLFVVGVGALVMLRRRTS
jgi:hypothetical protein